MNLKYRISVLLSKSFKSLHLRKDSFVSNYITYFLILINGSNHPRRIKNIHKIINNVYLNDYERIKNVNFICERKKYKIVNLFVGDSHAEFFGRTFFNTDSDKLFLTFHTGATLLSEFGSSTYVINKIYKMINFLRSYCLRSHVKLNVIFCFGEIDVRTFFYQKIKIEKIYKNTSDYSNSLSKNFHKNFVNLRKILIQKEIVNVNFYFNDIVPPSSKKYYLPENLKVIQKIRTFIQFPNFGTLKKRISYRKNLIQKMKIRLKNEQIKFLDLNKNEEKIIYLSRKNSIDGHHVTDFKLIKKIHKQIF